jgi:hypothetical protein
MNLQGLQNLTACRHMSVQVIELVQYVFEVMLPSACSFIVDVSLQHKTEHITTCKKIQQKNSEADYFRNIKVKHHKLLKMAM